PPDERRRPRRPAGIHHQRGDRVLAPPSLLGTMGAEADPMRLELRWSRVEELAAAPTTRLSEHRLEVDLEGLRARLAADPRLARVHVDLAHPGERCRIGRVLDVIAPR